MHFSVCSSRNLLPLSLQEVPDDLYHMAQRYTAWKEKHDNESSMARGRGGRGRSRGRRDSHAPRVNRGRGKYDDEFSEWF